MRRMRSGAAGLILLTAPAASPADVNSAIQPATIQPFTLESAARRASEQTYYRKWKVSLAPVVASQALDAASSYGMRELNPMLAGPDGRFGPRATVIKLSATTGLLGLEYLIVRKHPRAARVFSMINWSASVLTAGLAAHNFAIR